MSKIISTLIASFLIVAALLGATFAIYWYNDEITREKVKDATNTFQDDVRKKGYISPAAYDDFIKSLSKTGNYDIRMEHIRYIIYPLKPDNLQYTAQKPWIELKDIYEERYIRNVIYTQSQDYRMEKGDDFFIEVTNKNITGAMVFMNLLGGRSINTIWAQGGGMVKSEEY